MSIRISATETAEWDSEQVRILDDQGAVLRTCPYSEQVTDHLQTVADTYAAEATTADESEACRIQMRDKTDELDAWNTAAGTWLATDGAHGNVDLPHYRALRSDVIALGYTYRDLPAKSDRLRAQFDWMTGQSQIATSMLADYNVVLTLEVGGFE